MAVGKKQKKRNEQTTREVSERLKSQYECSEVVTMFSRNKMNGEFQLTSSPMKHKDRTWQVSISFVAGKDTKSGRWYFALVKWYWVDGELKEFKFGTSKPEPLIQQELSFVENFVMDVGDISP